MRSQTSSSCEHSTLHDSAIDASIGSARIRAARSMPAMTTASPFANMTGSEQLRALARQNRRRADLLREALSFASDRSKRQRTFWFALSVPSCPPGPSPNLHGGSHSRCSGHAIGRPDRYVLTAAGIARLASTALRAALVMWAGDGIPAATPDGWWLATGRPGTRRS